jgi:hypothetical protein
LTRWLPALWGWRTSPGSDWSVSFFSSPVGISLPRLSRGQLSHLMELLLLTALQWLVLVDLSP